MDANTQKENLFESIQNALHYEIEEIPPQNRQSSVSHSKAYMVRLTYPEKPEPTSEDLDLNDAVAKEYMIQSADILFEHDEFLLARHLYTTLLKKSTKDMAALSGFAKCLFRLNEIPQAKKCFQKLLDATHEERYHLWLGLCAMAEDQDEKALSLFQQVLHPQTLAMKEQFELYKAQGNCFNRRENPELALQFYDKALEIDPKSELIFINKGTVELQRRETEKAKQFYERALEINSKSSRATCGLGLVCVEKKDFFAAKELFEKALDLDELNRIALYQLAYVCDQLKQEDSLFERIQRLTQKQPKAKDAQYLLATLYYKRGEWRECQTALETLLSIDPQNKKAKELRDKLFLRSRV